MDGIDKNLHFSVKRKSGKTLRMARISTERRRDIPVFFLYGEMRRQAGPRFLHLEPLEDRSRPSGWNIRAHAHADLNHVLFITAGSGLMTADGDTIRLDAPCVLLVPARTVHGFSYTPDAAGWVLTVADAYLAELSVREPDFAALFAAPCCLPGAPEDGLENRLECLARELAWNAPGYTSAIEGHLLGLLVAVLRQSRHAARIARPAGGRAAALVARFRDLIESDYRKAVPLRDYAERLRVTDAQLRRACLQVTRQPPVQLIRDRIFLEAQRMLLYTNMTVIEAAQSLAFSDSAYFTRFFTKRAGCSPRALRRQAALTRKD
jgi:AraC family transcriptional activator of pobA